MDDEFLKDAELARRVVSEGLKVLKEEGGQFAESIGKLSVLSAQEARDFRKFQNQIEEYFEYVKLKKPERPLCLGVFGPPGSGKSFAVKQMLGERAIRLINLSQLQGPSDLSAALAEGTRWSVGQTPVVFFDEFDSQLAGTPLGWLQWLLAPMQDGVVVDHGNPVDLKCAVFVFAGGTADTFEEFPDAHEEYFRTAKGPDFVSRLRGHLNIRGVNEGPFRRVRRAIVFRLAVERVAPRLLDDQKRILKDRMAIPLIDQILAVGRFRHGARSIEALVEMSMNHDSTQFAQTDLPPPGVLASHVDLGLLSDLVITLSVADVEGKYAKRLKKAWPDVATRLLEGGAGLVYGGDWSTEFTKSLVEASLKLPIPLGFLEAPNEDYCARPRSSRVTWVRSGRNPSENESPDKDRVDIRRLSGLSKEELSELGLPENTNLSKFKRSKLPDKNWKASPDWCKWLGNALAMFRMRALVTRFADAHLILGGRTQGFSGRFPGIAEETMLSLAAGNAIYVCGGFEGAAEAVGQVLGLGDPWAVVPDCLRRDAHGPSATLLETAVKEWESRFQLPYRNDLPLDYKQLVEFLRDHALGGPKWPYNGLTADENRTLFKEKDAKEIVKLVTKGLGRRFAKS